MLDMPAYANRLGAMIMALNEGVPDRASTPPDSWGRYCCGHCGRAVSPERDNHRVCGSCHSESGWDYCGNDEVGDAWCCRGCGDVDESINPGVVMYGAYCDPDQGGCGHVGPAIDRRERDE